MKLKDILKFPLSYSNFIRKRDAEYEGDSNGDFVMAEDVNELQESIERIERVLDLEKLTRSVVDELNDKVSKNAIMDFGAPLFIRYGGSSISAYESVEERINGFAYIPYVMLNKEVSSNFDYFLDRLKASGSKVFGIVNCQNPKLSALETEIDWFKEKGFHGIMLDYFGYEHGMTRSVQNSALEYIHQKEMMAVITGEIETTLFNKIHDNNPLQEDLQVVSTDFYLINNIFVENGKKKDPSIVTDSIFQLNKAQSEKRIKVIVEDTTSDLQGSVRIFAHGKMMATLFNLDGYSLVPNSRYSLSEKVERFVQGYEIGAWKVDEPIYIEEENQTSRAIAKGKIVFDKNKNKCYVSGVGLSPEIYTWENKQIPGEAVDLGSAEYDEIVIDAIVDAINENDSKIHFSKIDGLGSSGTSPEIIKDIVVRAINCSPAATKKNPPDGYDSLAGNDYIHGGIINHIDASSITSGILDVDRIKTNVIEAVNAYIGHAVIDSAKIGELTAGHIQSSVVDAINIYAENIVGDKALINSAVIGTLSSEHISSAVIEAINASIENAVIDSAKIGELTADHITAGMIEAIKVSADSGEFDQLQAAIIDAINASIENAFIDGALIQDGTIREAHIFEATILDAFIHSLDAGKITTGKLRTNVVTLEGEDNHLSIVNNRIQILDKLDNENGEEPTYYERVVIGDVNQDGSVYGMRIRGVDGESVLFDENGLTKEGLTDGIVDNDKLAENAVDNKNVIPGSLQGDRLVADAITAREIMAKEITGDHIKSFSITANDAVFAEGTILAADIGKAQITDAHIDSLDAKSIKTGVLSADRIQVGYGTQFEEGFSPDELREEMENRIPYRVEVISTNGIIFKSGQISTTLIAKVYKGPEEITDDIPSARFNWIRVGANGEADEVWNEQHKGMKQVEIDQDDVIQRATFLCEVLES